MRSTTVSIARGSGTATGSAGPNRVGGSTAFQPASPGHGHGFIWRREYPETLWMEPFLAVCSAWTAAQMWLWPKDFVIGPIALSVSKALTAKEHSWAIFCGLAAVLKLGGLACRLWARRDPLSDRILICSTCDRLGVSMTICGLFMSVVFWTIVAGSLLIDPPHSVSAVSLIGLSFGAAWQLAQWHPAPDVRQ